jgi:hypothetical protein
MPWPEISQSLLGETRLIAFALDHRVLESGGLGEKEYLTSFGLG